MITTYLLQDCKYCKELLKYIKKHPNLNIAIIMVSKDDIRTIKEKEPRIKQFPVAFTGSPTLKGLPYKNSHMIAGSETILNTLKNNFGYSKLIYDNNQTNWYATLPFAGGSSITDISVTHNTNNVIVNSSDGNDGTINEATILTAGVLSSSDKIKLDTISPSADVTSTNETSHADVVVDGDFTSDGFLKRSGGEGNYAVDTNSYSLSTHNHDSDYVDQITSTDNSVPSFDGASGQLQDKGVLFIKDDNTVSINNISNLKGESETLTTTTQTEISSFVAATYSSGKFLIQVKDSVTGEVQISELLVVHDGTTASATEYGVVYTGSSGLATFDVDINAGNVRILATGASTNSTTYKVSETLMTT